MENEASDLFNEVYREISTELGCDTAIAIHNMFKGQQVTFPVHLFSSKKVQDTVAKEYDGKNIRDLAKKYDYSEKTVRRMIKEGSEG